MTTETEKYYPGTGRRKNAIAQIRVSPGTGNVIINGKPLDQYFPRIDHRHIILEPIATANQSGKIDVMIKVIGGGNSGQAGAIRHGVARALVKMDETLRTPMRSIGALTRDARIKERKKYGLKRARTAPQYTKR
ncbi:MAG: 30S ribosomal protein S9 [Chloroflexi bacterium]|nr:30S ribosomal protein S9 [Chloroflexota bacterium]